MLLLTSTSDKIRLITSAALTVDVHVSWVDNASGIITPGRTNTAISTATTTDIVASPASGSQRNVKTILVRNKDISSDIVTVVHTDGSTIVQLYSCTLATGEDLAYDEATGFKHFDTTGAILFDYTFPAIAANQLVANATGSSAQPTGTAISTYLDSALGTTAGTIPTRGNSTWTAAAPNNPCPNILLNPSMEIDQGNEGAAVTTQVYVVDGWKSAFATISPSYQRVADAPTGFTNSLKITVTTGVALGASDFLQSFQNIEANNITDWAIGTASAKTLALSFWVKSSIAPYTFCATLLNAASNRSYPASVTINSANTWEQKTVIIPLDVSGTWVTSGTAVAAIVTFTPAIGSTFQGTANTWNAGNFQGTSSNTNTIFSTNGATFQVTGVKLEISPIVTAFKRLTISEELIRCQRYYEKSYDIGSVPGVVGTNGADLLFGGATASAGKGITFKVTKRIVPTTTLYSPTTGASGKARDFTNAADVTASLANVGVSGFAWFLTAGGTTSNVQLQWTADARL